ncbi:methyltransferase type 12 [Fusarium pseudoanthophilum]|uniref:Methyltransferase type 12 n=1 Tax=Fusarium pseudoanthophilum TaxID=48495 RepID=A0A8H5PQD4_9HYPO|nr:methyltransferase type 12 [Fusarium pseudoanthophilum]
MSNGQQKSGVAQKASFADLYNQKDPRGYLTTLAPLQYTIPQQVLPLFQRLHQLSCQGTAASAILDVCCSYGINGALLRHHVDMEAWTAHYTDSKLDSKHQVLADKEFFASRERSPKPLVLGLDKADHAVRYALDVGLIDGGWVEDLEANDPSPGLREALQGVSLIICTGGVSYLSARTFARIIAAVGRPSNLWVASTVIRTSSYEEVATELRKRGLVTERLPGVVLRQRRFASAKEQSDAVAHVAARGLVPTGFEEMGYVCADVFISRSVEEISRPPIAELVADLGEL